MKKRNIQYDYKKINDMLRAGYTTQQIADVYDVREGSIRFAVERKGYEIKTLGRQLVCKADGQPVFSN